MRRILTIEGLAGSVDNFLQLRVKAFKIGISTSQDGDKRPFGDKKEIERAQEWNEDNTMKNKRDYNSAASQYFDPPPCASIEGLFIGYRLGTLGISKATDDYHLIGINDRD
eukprot:Gb_39964 [translate_table: standard]